MFHIEIGIYLEVLNLFKDITKYYIVDLIKKKLIQLKISKLRVNPNGY
jgi:hypothetical protein